MRIRPLLAFVSLTIVLIAAACAPATPVLPGSLPPDNSGTGQDSGNQGNIPQTGSQTAEEQVREAVSQFLTTQLNAAAGAIDSISVTEAEWPDACLGLGGEQACAQVITPGWLIQARINGQDYALRANQDASVIRLDLSGSASSQTGGETGASGQGEGAEDHEGIEREIGGDDTTGTGNTAESGLDVGNPGSGQGQDRDNPVGGGTPGSDSEAGGGVDSTTGDTGEGSTGDSGGEVDESAAGNDTNTGNTAGDTGTDSTDGDSGLDSLSGNSGTVEDTDTAKNSAGGSAGSVPNTGGIQLFMVEENGDPQSGQAFGVCGDVLVGVPANVEDSGDVAANLEQAYEALFNMDQQTMDQQRLISAFGGSDLRVESVTFHSNGVAIIRLFGDLNLEGECDDDRVRFQLQQLGRQFDGVRAVNIFLNDRPLDAALESQGTSSD